MDFRGLKIGYSFWGFLYEGIADTPDGGRIHRLPLIKALLDEGTSIYCLQENRDFLESNTHRPLDRLHFSCAEPPPEIDFLFVEYRWPIPGRNTDVDTRSPNYTPDLARQDYLLSYYSDKIPVIVWDKDLKLSEINHQFEIAENTISPSKGRHRLLFSFDHNLRQQAEARLPCYTESTRIVDLIYIGNQYQRDHSFKKYISTSAKYLDTQPIVYGNWTKYPNKYKKNLELYPRVEFRDRLHFRELNKKYATAFSTVLIAPDRYYKKGQITQRIFEALVNHTIPFIPIEYKGIESVILDELFVNNAQDVCKKIREFRAEGDVFIRKLIQSQISKLDIYSPPIQAKSLLSIYDNLENRSKVGNSWHL